MDIWIKVLELECDLIQDLTKLVKDKWAEDKAKVIVDEAKPNVPSLECQRLDAEFYQTIYLLGQRWWKGLTDVRELNQRITDLGGMIHAASDNPELAWAALNYFMLNTCLNFDDLFVGDFKHVFETLRIENKLPVFESPLHFTILEMLKRINLSQSDRLNELLAYKERAHEPDIETLKKLLGVNY